MEGKLGRQLNRHNVFSSKELRYRDIYPAKPRVVCPNCVAHFLEVVQ